LWRTEIQIDQLLADQGGETSSTNENHMVLEGPPGTAKTTFARIVAEILFGLGKIQRPDVMEVTGCATIRFESVGGIACSAWQ
jgi:Holliday junction resolvasome RuvABC ATP-dependent DNA helicase subunit